MLDTWSGVGPRSLKHGRNEFLGYSGTNGASNTGTEAVTGLIELPRRIARGSRGRDNYRSRMLLLGSGQGWNPPRSSAESRRGRSATHAKSTSAPAQRSTPPTAREMPMAVVGNCASLMMVSRATHRASRPERSLPASSISTDRLRGPLVEPRRSKQARRRQLAVRARPTYEVRSMVRGLVADRDDELAPE